MTTSPLSYNGFLIAERSEMLSLTDMWRAVQGKPDQRPSQWLKQEGTKAFLEYLKTTVAQNHSEQNQQLTESINENGTWNTWAHWQIGLAYAKYLSPEFHVWCNHVVRNHMERRNVPVQSIPPIIEVASLAEAMEPVTRGLCKLLEGQDRQQAALGSHGRKIEALEEGQQKIRDEMKALAPRRDFGKRTQQQWAQIVRLFYRGLCPCCQRVEIASNTSLWLPDAQMDHWYARNKNLATQGWPVCSSCNHELESHRITVYQSAFEVFQRHYNKTFLCSGQRSLELVS